MEFLYRFVKALFNDYIVQEAIDAANERDRYYEGQLKSEQNRGYQRGYAEAQSEFEARLDKLVVDKYTAQHWLVNPNNVLFISENGIVSLDRKPLSTEEAKQLREEAMYIEHTRIWSIFQDTIRHKAIEQAVIQSTDFSHVLPGKMMIHNLSVMQKIVERCKQIKA